jgi:hypothetical protein
VSITIKSITPKESTRGCGPQYNFEVVMADDDGHESKITISAGGLFDYRQFAVIVLEQTGRLYGDGTYQSWPGELRKHLNAHWIKVKRDKGEKPLLDPRPARATQGEALEPFPLPPTGHQFWEDPGVGQAVS